MNPRFPVCYLDLDGVLVNFVLGAFMAHGRFDLLFSEVQWNFHEQLGIPAKEFYAPMGREFWAGLPWTPEGKNFLAQIEHVFGEENVVLLTAPVDTPGCAEGKIEWIKREMPSYAKRFFIGSPKHLAACETKLLVDDNEQNVNTFRVAGGSAVLVPRPWNSRRRETNDFGLFGPYQIAREVAEVHLNLLREMR